MSENQKARGTETAIEEDRLKGKTHKTREQGSKSLGEKASKEKGKTLDTLSLRYLLERQGIVDFISSMTRVLHKQNQMSEKPTMPKREPQ